MLTTTLRNLERDGMVTRELFAEVPPRMEFELTELGLAVLEPMQALMEWTNKNWPQVKAARESFDRR